MRGATPARALRAAQTARPGGASSLLSPTSGRPDELNRHHNCRTPATRYARAHRDYCRLSSLFHRSPTHRFRRGSGRQTSLRPQRAEAEASRLGRAVLRDAVGRQCFRNQPPATGEFSPRSGRSGITPRSTPPDRSPAPAPPPHPTAARRRPRRSGLPRTDASSRPPPRPPPRAPARTSARLRPSS